MRVVIEPQSRFFESAGLRLHYLVWGDERNPPLVLVHGGRDHARSWDFVAERLLDRFCAYALDLRGHGDSGRATGGQYRLTDHVLDLATLVRVLDRGPVNLIAHSMGGRVALDYTGAFPETVSRLCAIEGFGWRLPPLTQPVARLRTYAQNVWQLMERTEHVYPSLEEAGKRMAEANKRLTPSMVDHLTKHAVRKVEGGYVWKFDHFIRLERLSELLPAEIAELWRNISCPLLLVWGEDSDRRFPARAEMMSTLARAENINFNRSGHWVHHDQLDEFVAAVRDFMR